MNVTAFAKWIGTVLLLITLLQQTYRRTLDGVRATIGAVLRAVTAEHTLALRAATKAALPRQTMAQVRAMYVPSEPHQHGTDAGRQKRMTRETR